MQDNRDLSFDAFRGIAIIAVVGIHASAFYLGANNSAGGWNLPMVAYQQLFNFAVPVFIFISGYWLSKKPVESLEDYKKFLTRRVSRILIPYFVWSLAYIAYEIIVTRKLDVRHIIVELATGSAPGRNYYWFILLIAQFYIMTPFLQYLNRRRNGFLFVLILNVFALILRYVLRLYLNWSIPLMGLFFSWLVFYQVGLLAGSSGSITFNLRRLRFFIFPAILIFLLASQIEAIFLISNFKDSYAAVSPLKFSSFFYSLSLILGFLFVRERFKNWPQFLVSIGRYSFGIYLLHVGVLKNVIRVSQNISVISSFQPVYQLELLVVTVVICFVLIYVTRKLLPENICFKYLGF